MRRVWDSTRQAVRREPLCLRERKVSRAEGDAGASQSIESLQRASGQALEDVVRDPRGSRQRKLNRTVGLNIPPISPSFAPRPAALPAEVIADKDRQLVRP